MSTIQLENREAWLEERKRGLGASDVSAALGINPWKSPFALWAEKCGLLPDEDLAAENESIEWGLRLERPIAHAFGERTGRKVQFPSEHGLSVHPNLPFLRASLDAMQLTEARPEVGSLEIKTTSAWNSSDWANGAVPLYYQVQCQIQMAVCDYPWASIACLVGGQRLVWRDVERDDAFVDAALPHLENFWRMVEQRECPPIDGSCSTAETLGKLHPDDDGQTVELPPEAVQWIADLEAAKAQAKQLNATIDLNNNRLKAAIGSATFGELVTGQRFSFKTQSRSGYTVQPCKFRVLKSVKG